MTESKTLSIIIIFLVFIVLMVALIFGDKTQNNNETANKIKETSNDRFEKIEEWSNNFIMYDKKTKVQYFVFEGGITPILDSDGKPILYLEGE